MRAPPPLVRVSTLTTATGKITQFEQVFLKWFDLNHLLKIKYHMLDICAPNERDAMLLDWLHLGEMFTMQTEQLGLRGTLRYLQDTSATHVSTFGVMVYNVGPPLSRMGTRPDASSSLASRLCSAAWLRATSSGCPSVATRPRWEMARRSWVSWAGSCSDCSMCSSRLSSRSCIIRTSRRCLCRRRIL